MAATYRAVMLTKSGGPEVLQIVELPVESPGPGQLRVRVHAAGVGSTDLIVVARNYRYAPKIPFVPRYEAAGVVEAVGVGVTGFEIGQRVAALTVYGAFAEVLVRDAEHFLPIPDSVSDVDAATVILNYVTAWQMIHRVAKVIRPDCVGHGRGRGRRNGRPATFAAGGRENLRRGIETEARNRSCPGGDTHRLAGGAGGSPHASLEPRGVDYAFDAIGGANIGLCIGALRRGGMVVGYGFIGAPGKFAQLSMFANIFLGARLRGRVGKFYGITMLYRKDTGPLREDLPNIFALLAEKKIDPLVRCTFALLEAKQALALLATGSVEGKIVLVDQ